MRTRRTLQITLMTLLFGFSFTLFLFLTFPYEVLKEAVAAQISKATGYNVQIGDMSAAFHNLRVAETHLPSGSLIELSEDAEVSAIWQDIRKIDERLAAAVSAAHANTAELVRKLQIARQKITCYRSGEPELPRFEQSA